MIATQDWASLAYQATALLLGSSGWLEARQLRNGRWVVRFGRGADPGELALGWGGTEEWAYQRGIRCLLGEDTTLTTGQVAELLDVSPVTVRDHTRRGRLPCARKGDSNNPSRFTPSAVWELLYKLGMMVGPGEGGTDGQ